MRYFGFYTVIWLLCLLAWPQNSAASLQETQIVVSALKQAEKGNWTGAYATIRRISNVTARDTLNWYAYIKGAPNKSFQEISGFVSDHSQWPYLDKIRLEAENNLVENIPDLSVIKWFSQNQPITASGVDRYIRALIVRDKENDVRSVLRHWWPKASLTRDQQREFFSRYGRYLDRESHIGRLNTLLYKREYKNALAIADVLGKDYLALAVARKALVRNEANVNQLISAVPRNLRRDEGLLYQRLKWRRQNDLNDGAIEILNQAPRSSSMYSPRDWWRERHIIVRRLIEKKQYKKAYRLASSHKQTEGFPLAQAEWVSGFLALRFVKERWKAFEHFEKLYQNVKSPISKARGAYWSARASVALRHAKIAEQWYQVAARYPETFYGQLAQEKLNKKSNLQTDRSHIVSSSVRNNFKKQDLVQAASWLSEAGLRRESAIFLLHISKNAKSVEEYILTADLADHLGQRHVAIKIAQALQKEKNVSLYQYLYPYVTRELKNIKNVEWAFINGIIRQESRFDYAAVSHAGARGLMQLMPATAREVASRHGVRHQTGWLTSRPSHNIYLGSGYLRQMLNRFNGNYAMAAAAYNAGPGRVDRWLREFGDPRKKEIDLIDWIELIPIYETRNYVQRVLEGVYVYRDRLKGQHNQVAKTIHVKAK